MADIDIELRKQAARQAKRISQIREEAFGGRKITTVVGKAVEVTQHMRGGRLVRRYSRAGQMAQDGKVRTSTPAKPLPTRKPSPAEKPQRPTRPTAGEAKSQLPVRPKAKPDSKKPTAEPEKAKTPKKADDGKAWPDQWPESRDRYMKGGKYDAERLRLHKQLIDAETKGVPASSEPTVFLMGGGTAAGKSTIIKPMRKDGRLPSREKSVEINADDIKEAMPDYQSLVKSGDKRAASWVHEESSDISKAMMRAAYEQKSDILLDGTGDSGLTKLKGKVDAMRAEGYKVVANYVTIDTDTAVKRSAGRAERTGRFVPEEVIRSIHADVSNTFADAVKANLFDEVNLWDTAYNPPKLVASGGGGKKFTVHEPDDYQKFLDKGKAKMNKAVKTHTDQVPDGMIEHIPFEYADGGAEHPNGSPASWGKGKPVKDAKVEKSAAVAAARAEAGLT